MDLVSVIIPYYKKRNFIKETLISVINQSYDNLEIFLIYDDTNLNDFEFLTNHVDFYNAMTYGTHGDWSSHAGHLSPLYASPVGDPDGSCHTNMDYLINSRSIPSSKINLGLPFWGLMWDAPDINEPFTGSSADIIYYNIPELIGNGWNYNWDSDK